MTRRLVVLAFTWVALFAHGLSGQLGQPTPAQPVFRAGVDAVEFDVFVTDQKGNPVTGLTAADFQLEEDGVAQTISSFSFVNIPFKSGAAASGPPVVEPDVQTNQKAEGRLYVFAIDGLGDVYALRTRRFLRRFVEQHFTADDVAALVYLGYGQARNTQDFTGNTRLLLRAIDNVMGGASATSEGASGTSTILASSVQPNHMGGPRALMEGLRALTESLAQIRGKRKVMLYFTHGLALDVFDTLGYSGGTRSIAFDDLHAAIGAATRGGVAIYPIDPRGLTLDGSLATAVDLRALADATGAEAIVNTNSIATGLARIVRENSTYYVLGYSSTNDRREGRFRKIRVRATRPGLVVRARTGYLEPLKQAKPPAMTPIGDVPTALATALAQPLSNPGVPMQVFAAPYRGADRQARVLIAQEMDANALGLTRSGDDLVGDVSVTTVAVRFDAKVYGGKPESTPVRFERAADGVGSRTVRVLSEIRVPAGRYQLRIAGGTTGRAGSVIYDLEVPDFSKLPLALSGVSLTASATPDVVIADLAGGGAQLPGAVTTRREFGGGDTVTLYAEVYENMRKAAVHNVDVRAELRAADGRVVRTVSQQRASTELADGRSGFTLIVPLNGTATGDHVLHVEARANVGDAAVVSRDIPIQIR